MSRHVFMGRRGWLFSRAATEIMESPQVMKHVLATNPPMKTLTPRKRELLKVLTALVNTTPHNMLGNRRFNSNWLKAKALIEITKAETKGRKEPCPAQPLHPDNPTPDSAPVHTKTDRSANDSATHDPRDYVG